MKKAVKTSLVVLALLVAAGMAAWLINKSSFNPNPGHSLGQPLDSLNGVVVYYNGMTGHSAGRNIAPDGYNIGMKYQCVEFVKRYYYQRLGHKMPDPYGNAKDFFNTDLPDSAWNSRRGLMQFTNGSTTHPRAEDLLIFCGHKANPFGHVAIVAWADSNRVAIIQQNPGPYAPSRDTFRLSHASGKWTIAKPGTLGWLRKTGSDTVAHQ